MGSPSRTRLQSLRFFSCWGPWLPWLLQPQKQNQKLQPMLTPGMDMDTADTDTVDTTGLMAIMAITERGLLKPNPLPNLLLQLTLTLTPTLGTVIMAMATVAMDGAATTGLMATMATMERGLLMLNPLPNLPQQLTLMLTPTLGMVIMAMATVAMDGAATTGLMAIAVTGAKQAIRKVDSSSDCDFPSTLASISRACA